jgi:hypothetical protein
LESILSHIHQPIAAEKLNKRQTPLPKSRPTATRQRKRQTVCAEVLTSSPYNNQLQLIKISWKLTHRSPRIEKKPKQQKLEKRKRKWPAELTSYKRRARKPKNYDEVKNATREKTAKNDKWQKKPSAKRTDNKGLQTIRIVKVFCVGKRM